MYANADVKGYRKIISEISELSHTVADKVSNVLYRIKFDIVNVKSCVDNERLSSLLKGLEQQIQTSMTTINNFKAINEGIKFKYSIDYRDDGKGIPKDNKQWVFLPLNTT